jgi:cardiolipin synthase (CMP-forming)
MIRSLRIARRGSRGSILDSRIWRQSQCQRPRPLPISLADLLLGGYSDIGSVLPPKDRWLRVRSGRRISHQDGYSWLRRAVLNYSSKSKQGGNRQNTKRPTDGNRSNSPLNDNEDNSNSIYDHWSKQLASPPNLITLSRIASAPLLSYLIISQQNEIALVGCLVAGASDVLDGYLAKQHNMATVLGTYLDPLADKVIINVLSVSLCYTGTLPTPLVALWLARDTALTVGTYLYVAMNTSSGKAVMDPWTTPLKVNPTVTSKVNTALQFATLSLAILAPLYPGLEGALTTLCWGTGLTTVASGISYLGYSAFSASGNRPHSSAGDDANPPTKP